MRWLAGGALGLLGEMGVERLAGQTYKKNATTGFPIKNAGLLLLIQSLFLTEQISNIFLF